MDQLPRLRKRELICLLLFTCNYVVSVWRGFLFLWVLWMGYVILFWHSLSLPYKFLRQIAEYVPIDVQKRFYQGYILPLIDFGSNTWGAASKANIDRVSKLQNRAARIILQAYFDTPSSVMFQELSWPTIENRLKYKKAVFTYRALNKLTPDFISNLLKPLSESHSLNLRTSENGTLNIPRACTAFYDTSFTCSAPKLWNALSQTVRDADSLLTFKKHLKCILI